MFREIIFRGMNVRGRDGRPLVECLVPARLDAIDRKILKELQEDGRITNVELASRVGISAEKGDPLGQMKLSSRAKAQAVARDATALLTACGLALRSFD